MKCYAVGVSTVGNLAFGDLPVLTTDGHHAKMKAVETSIYEGD